MNGNTNETRALRLTPLRRRASNIDIPSSIRSPLNNAATNTIALLKSQNIVNNNDNDKNKLEIKEKEIRELPINHNEIIEEAIAYKNASIFPRDENNSIYELPPIKNIHDQIKEIPKWDKYKDSCMCVRVPTMNSEISQCAAYFRGSYTEDNKIDISDYLELIGSSIEDKKYSYNVLVDREVLTTPQANSIIDLKPLDIIHNITDNIQRTEHLSQDERKRLRMQARTAKQEAARKLDALERAGVEVERAPSRADIPHGVFGTELEMRLTEIRQLRLKHREDVNRAAHERALAVKESKDPLELARTSTDATGARYVLFRLIIDGPLETKLRNKYFNLLPVIGKEHALSGYIMLLRKAPGSARSVLVGHLTGTERDVRKFLAQLIVSTSIHHAQLDIRALGTTDHMLALDSGLEGQQANTVLQLHDVSPSTAQALPSPTWHILRSSLAPASYL